MKKMFFFLILSALAVSGQWVEGAKPTRVISPVSQDSITSSTVGVVLVNKFLPTGIDSVFAVIPGPDTATLKPDLIHDTAHGVFYPAPAPKIEIVRVEPHFNSLFALPCRLSLSAYAPFDFVKNYRVEFPAGIDTMKVYCNAISCDKSGNAIHGTLGTTTPSIVLRRGDKTRTVTTQDLPHYGSLIVKIRGMRNLPDTIGAIRLSFMAYQFKTSMMDTVRFTPKSRDTITLGYNLLGVKESIPAQCQMYFVFLSVNSRLSIWDSLSVTPSSGINQTHRDTMNLKSPWPYSW